MDVFDLVAKISIDDSEYEKGLDNAKKSTSVFGQVFKANIASDLVGKAFSGIVEGAKKGAGALISLTKQAVSGYGEAEQLVGGVEKLYGDSAKIIEGYAADAYRTSGMSANQYMETATQFSASLISSLGGDTKKAAEQTDVAMRAISDNVNVFGSNMEDVTNAFKGFSKQNYTMLDNLKLGYGGTKEEMARLIDDANEYAASIGRASDLSIGSFSDIVTAVELVQEKQHIAGTTAKEAATTLQGSLTMLKTSWENLVTGIGDGSADMDKLIGNFVDSLVGRAATAEDVANGTADSVGAHINGVVDNFLPVIEKAITGIGTIITKLVPVIAEKLPGLIQEIVPPVLSAIGALFESIVKALPGLLQTISDAIPGMIKIITDALPEILPSLVQAIGILIDGIATALPELIDQIIKILPELAKSIWDGLTKAFENASPQGKIVIIGILSKALGGGLLGAVDGVKPYVAGAKTAFGKIIDLILPTDANGSALPGMFEAATKSAGPLTAIVTKLGAGFSSFGSILTGTVLPAIGGFIASPVGLTIMGIVGAIVAVIAIIKNWGAISEWFGGVWGKVTGGLKTAVGKIGGFFGGIKDKIGGSLKGAYEQATQYTGGFLTDMQQAYEESGGGLVGVFSAYSQAIRDGIDFVVTAFGNLFNIDTSGFMEKINEVWRRVTNLVGDAMTAIGELPGKILEFINKLPEYLGYAIGYVAGALYKMGETVVNWIATNVPAFIESVRSFLAALPGKIWDALTAAFAKIGEWGANVLSWITTTVPQMIASIVKFYAELPGKIWEILTQVISKIGEWGANVLSWIATTVPQMISNIVNFFAELPGKIWNFLAQAVTKIGAWGSQVISLAARTGQQFLSSVVSFFSQLPANVWNWLSNTLSNVGSFVAQMGSKALEAGRSFFNNIVSTLSSLPGEMLSIGKNIVSGIWKGISSMVGWIGNKVKGFAGGIAKGFKSALGIHSPSKVFAGFGKFSVLGYGKGWEDNVDSVIDDMQASLDAKSIGTKLTADMSALPGDIGIGAGAAGRTVNAAPITINVYGAEGQDVKELADIVAERINQAVRRESMVYA